MACRKQQAEKIKSEKRARSHAQVEWFIPEWREQMLTQITAIKRRIERYE
jgi:hypothetical protein